ncbi:MAG: nucleoside-diphosphate kinase [Candidatus Marinimicrobia bacterium]|nr:nucleoside-diphosphate kinase [Candidatus Neomarinimicrobiota bacterium]
MSNRTLAIIKPDAIQNRLTGKIIDHILDSGFDIIAMKKIRLSVTEAKEFYAIHKEKPFYSDLVSFMTSSPCVVLTLQKEEAVEAWRDTIGATDPAEASPGTIRNLYADNVQKNAVHGSDSDENAIKEIAFFFSTNEILMN